MKCEQCGKEGVKICRISRSYGKGAQLFVIENIPIYACSQCGESYFSAETMHEIERMKVHRKAIAQKHTIAVAEYAI